jgi:hypothetical protein
LVRLAWCEIVREKGNEGGRVTDRVIAVLSKKLAWPDDWARVTAGQSVCGKEGRYVFQVLIWSAYNYSSLVFEFW